MKVVYTAEFDEQLSNIRDKSIAKRILSAIIKLENANSLREVTNVKPMVGYPSFYRISFSKYRIGFQLIDQNVVMLLAVDHRSKIYKHFPNNYA